MEDLTIRPAGPADLDSAATLFDAYRQFYGAASDLSASREFLAERLELAESIVLLAFPASAAGTGRDAVGLAQLYRSFSSVSMREIVILNDLYVVPEWRGAGTGRRLVEHAAAYATGAGAIRLELATQRTNQRALRLYQSMGFVPDNEFIHLSLELSDTAPQPGP